MKICNFCGHRTNDNSVKTCESCGSKQFSYVCPNCSSEFEGKFCPTCGTKYDAVGRICPDCGEKYFSKSCPNCGYNENTKKYTQTSNTSASIGRGSLYTSPAHKNAVVALTLSVIGMMICMPLFTIIGFAMAIMGNRKDDVDEKSRNINKITIVISIIAFVGCIVVGILYALGMGINFYRSSF